MSHSSYFLKFKTIQNSFFHTSLRKRKNFSCYLLTEVSLIMWELKALQPCVHNRFLFTLKFSKRTSDNLFEAPPILSIVEISTFVNDLAKKKLLPQLREVPEQKRNNNAKLPFGFESL